MTDAPGAEGQKPHPEVTADKKAAMPATKESKQGILNAIDEKMKDPRAYGDDEITIIDLICEDESNQSMGVTRNVTPTGPRRIVATINEVEIKGEGNAMQRNFVTNEFTDSPDGIQVERQTFSAGPSHVTVRSQEEFADMQEEWINEFLKRKKAEVEERELGLTLFSEKHAGDLLEKIRKAKPRVIEDDEDEDPNDG